MTTDSDSIIRKVQSLLALAGNNANEQEAALAMEKAQELLAKYNLDMAEIGQRESKPADAPRSKEKVERSAMFKFQRDIGRHWPMLTFVCIGHRRCIRMLGCSGPTTITWSVARIM